MLTALKYLRNLFFSVLFLQILNISFNYTNIYSAGQSGFRHKIAFKSYDLSDILTAMADVGINPDTNDSKHSTHHIFIENFDLGFSVALIDFNALAQESGLAYYPENVNPHTDHIAELNSPPPKASRI